VPCLAAALLWVRHLDRGRRTDLALSILCFAAALLAKTSVVMMPFVLVAVAAQRRGRLQRADLLAAAPFFALSAGAAALTIWFQHRVAMMGEGTGRGLAERAGGAGWALWSYLERALVPVRVGVAYDPWPVGPGSLAFYLPALAAILLAGVVWRFRAPLRPVALALAFQAVMLVPVLGFVDLAFFATAPVSNHLQYLPLMGPVALLAWCLERLRQRWRPAALAAPALVVALALFTAWRASAFESDATLWVRAVQDAPDNPQVRSQLGNVRETQGRLEEAAAEFESITLRSRDEAWRRVGHMSAEYLRGHHAAAAAAAQGIVTSDANLMARRRAVAVLLATGHVDQGITVLQDLAARAPTNGEFSLLLARALRHAGRLPEAARVLDGWCRAHPGQPAFDWEYARVLLGLGDEDGARQRAASALGTRLDDPRVSALIRGAADGPR